ncbi:hypothetical protein BTO06_07565 [Tenacibaculum sp. SZ-18]|uniref:glycoside hydrolase family 25 protein n=1 Tax=Tenacibaculum sp. SZ-18 TaxID=754423 RepID=UPI000C2CFCC4|nr:GH25 family lysozyme [Tenacibaculum sp. SZ-18]AUC15002.1 hypothetical protein BTO06_07565 [Tenacibaculum sp. SZ-18]
MRSYNDFEIAILKEISSFRKEGIISLKDFLQKIFFNTDRGKALIIQLREQYTIYFIENKIYNNPITKRKAILEFSELLTLLDFLNSSGIISIFRKQHSIKEPMYFLSNLFHEPKIENNKIILNDNGVYTDKPEELKNAKGDVIYKGIQFNDSHFVIKNLMGSIVISDKINKIINEINPKKIKVPFYKKKSFMSFSLFSIAVLLLFGIHNSNRRNTNEIKNSIHKLHKKLNTPVKRTSNPFKTTTTKSPVKKYGIDISKWNGTILKNKLPDSLHFVICKATEGKNYLDPMFKDNWKQISNLNLKRGAYHFYVIKDNPIKQAKFFWEQIKDMTLYDFPPIIDVESGSSLNEKLSISEIKNLQTKLLRFLYKLETLSGRVPMIYSSHKFANIHLLSKKFSKYPLWIADYDNTKSPNLPTVWKNIGWTIWQKTPYYSVNLKSTDLDIYLER